jgi:hypothetical protein
MASRKAKAAINKAAIKTALLKEALLKEAMVKAARGVAMMASPSRVTVSLRPATGSRKAAKVLKAVMSNGSRRLRR